MSVDAKVSLVAGETDTRREFNGFTAQTEQVQEGDPYSGYLFCFVGGVAIRSKSSGGMTKMHACSPKSLSRAEHPSQYLQTYEGHVYTSYNDAYRTRRVLKMARMVHIRREFVKIFILTSLKNPNFWSDMMRKLSVT